MLFIVIHQVYELWFKEMLHELDHVAALFRSDKPHRAQHTLKRILTILKVIVAQLDILETMTPLEFLSFRARLEAASGFQSNQFRQIEFLLGAKTESALARFTAGSPRRIALERRFLAADALGRLPPLPGKREISSAHGSPDSRLLAAGRAHRRRSSRSCSMCIGATRRARRFASGSWTSTKGSPSGDIVTSGWWSGRSAASREQAARAEPPICNRRSGEICFPDLWEIRSRL